MNAIKTRLALHIALVVATSVAFGGVKYWDNPDFKAFDVDDYVQEGLVLNYDGIRNAGADQPHDSTATTWKNLGSGGATYDMLQKGNPTSSCWTDTGFYFEGKTLFVATNKFSVPNAYEVESLISAEHAKQIDIGYVFFLSTAYPRTSSNDGWRWGSIGIRKAGTTFNQNIGGTQYNGTLNLNTDGVGAGTAYRPVLLDESFEYLTAVANKTYSCIFTGLQEPTGAPGRSGLANGKTALSGNSLYPYLGGHDSGGETTYSEAIVGTVRNFRYYSAPLSYEQRTWNRVVDEARYFGRRAAIPVTNVVVACTIDGVADDHFALDAEGFTFTAPASRTVTGRRYVLGGYTLETWNGSAWGTPAVHDGETSCAISDASAKVRLTWQYARPEGEGYLVVYDVEDYVQDGLAWHYDGIHNVGANVGHSQTASVWANIGTEGPARNLVPFTWRAGDQGHWEADGYAFKGNSVWQFLSVPYTAPATFTMQTLIDANTAQGQVSNFPYIYSGSYNKFGLALWAPTSFCYANSQVQDRENMPRFTHSSRRYDYATTILDGSNNTMATFDGTTAPTSGDYTTGFRQFDSDVQSYALTDFRVGGYGAADASLVGKIKCLRFYPNKVLTTAELEQNRRVDEWRFFHRPSVTNVVVASETTRPFLHGNESEGPWQVSGSYTFTAPESVTVKGVDYVCDGYTIETWSGSAWGTPVAYEGASYVYTTAAGFVRLTWKWRATHGLRTAADYGIDDYVQDGLVVNYDGIRNAGPNADHDPNAMIWVNCANPGVYDLMRYSTNGTVGVSNTATAAAWNRDASRGAWTDNGFVFDKDAIFHEWMPFTAPSQYSIQSLVDAKASDQKGIGYIICDHNAAEWWKIAVGIRSSEYIANTFYLVSTFIPAADKRPAIAGSTFTYATAMMNVNDAVMFAGTTAPWTAPSTGGTTGHYKDPTKTQGNSVFGNGYSIGGHYPRTDELFKGTLKSYRFYNRVLTDAEVAHNRNVDQARYFGVLGVTNVVVEVEAGSGIVATPAVGEYLVEGSYEFTATRNGGTSALGYRVQDWDEARQRWVNPRTVESPTFVYDADSAAKVKVTWREIQPFFFIVR